MASTLPSTDVANDHTPAVIIEATYKDPVTGALYVHKDLDAAQNAWEEEAHVSPPKANEAFGDVESWAKYVTRFGEGSHLVTWNSTGLHAVLDYHADDEHAGRLQWTAHMPFERSPEWKAWLSLADGHAKGQRQAIEALEDRGAEIVEPTAGELMNLLRSLRTHVNKTASTELQPNGATRVSFNATSGVAAAGGALEMPSEFTIRIPILKGHVGEDGKPVLYELTVKLRASVDNDAKLALRFTLPNAERALEAVYLDRVQMAERLLGDGFDLLRAAG